MSKEIMREAIGIMGVNRIAKIFKKSEFTIYKYANSNNPPDSPHTDPVQLMGEFLGQLAANGGLPLAIRIIKTFIGATIKEQ